MPQKQDSLIGRKKKSKIMLITNKEILLISMLKSYASWAKVARELSLSLVDLGLDINICELEEDRFDRDFLLENELKIRTNKKASSNALRLYFSHPATYTKTSESVISIGFLVYESTIWPENWVNLAFIHLDRVLVPSHFCLQGLVNSGFPAHKIGIIPHGINPAIFFPKNIIKNAKPASLQLLFVGTCALRKGLDILLEAYEVAFSPQDCVSLIIKTNPYQDFETRKYLFNNWKKKVDALINKGYNIIVHEKNISEFEMAHLYRDSDLLCLPSRGEGFGMPLLESMACGTPVLTTFWSGPLDFVNEDNALIIQNYKIIPGGNMLIDFDGDNNTSFMVEPNVEEVHQKLKTAFYNRELLTEMGQKSILVAQKYTWQTIANIFVSDLKKTFIF